MMLYIMISIDIYCYLLWCYLLW